MLHDLRYALRLLLNNPGFTVVAVLALALGIGANTAIFSVVNAVILRPLGYKDPDHLVVVWENFKARSRMRNVISPANFLDWQTHNHVFEQMAAVRASRLNLTGSGEPEELQGQAVTASFFSVLGVTPLLGRTFTPEEDRPGGPGMVVLSYRLWQRRFGGEPGINGRRLTLGGTPATVIGVMPADFRVMAVLGQAPEIWEPMRLDPARDYRATSGRYMGAIARLKPGVSVGQAQAEMDAIARRLEQEHREFNTGWGVTLVPIHEQFVGEVRPALLVLVAAVAFLLLIACANVANLMLARAAARQREIAIRASIGAGRWRVVRQLLTESVLLSALGGAVGLLLGWWGVKALVAFAPRNVPRLDQVGLDITVLGFTMLISLLTGVVFGLAPAYTVARVNLTEALKQGGRAGAGGRSSRLRRALVVAEVTLSLVLLIGAGLMIRSFVRLQAVDPGLRPENVLTARVLLPGTQYRETTQRVAFFQQAVDRIQALPGVQSAGAINFLPFSGLVSGTGFLIEGRPKPPPGQIAVTDVTVVNPTYFRTMGIPLLRGRVFTARDTPEAPRTFVVNQSMVKRHFPNEEPLGKRLIVAMGDDVPGEIVGIVGDVKHHGLDADVRPMVFYSHPHLPMPFMTLVVRTASDPGAMGKAVVAAIRSIDPNQPVADIRPMVDVMADSVARSRFNMVLLGFFAGSALLLAAVGIYGVMAYTVTQRTQEIGIRMALGATRQHVLRMVVGQGAVLALIGVAAGLAASFALTRFMASLLFGVSPTDPVVFSGLAALLAAVAVVASWIPALRATRVDPVVALHYE